jgi:hypothetical protein
MRQVLTNWFLYHAFQNYLLAAPGKPLTDEEEQDELYPSETRIEEYFKELVRGDLEAQGLTDTTLQNEVDADVKHPRLDISAYSLIPFSHYESVEQKVAGAYAQQIEALEQHTITKQDSNRRDAQESVQRKFKELQTKYLDKHQALYAYTPIRTCIEFFEIITADFQQRYDQYAVQISEREDEIRSLHNRIQRAREQYHSAAKMVCTKFNWLPIPYIIPISGFMMATLAMGYLGWLIASFLDDFVLGLMLFSATLILGIGIFGQAINRATQAKNQLLRLYSSRLTAIDAQNTARQMCKCYTDLITMAETDYLNPVRAAQEYLEKQLREQLDTPVDLRRGPYSRRLQREIPAETRKLLYDTPRYELETSLLRDPDSPAHDYTGLNLLEEWYVDLFGTDAETTVQNDLDEFFESQGTLSKRLRSNDNLSTLIADLKEWVQKHPDKIARLRTASLQQYFAKYTEEQQRELIKLLVKRAHVYARLVKAALQEQENTDEGELGKLHIRLSRQDKNFIGQLLQANGLDKVVTQFDTEDSLRVDVLSALNRVPLNAIRIAHQVDVGSTSTLDADSTDMRFDEVTATDLSLYTLVALARGLGVLREEGNEWGLDTQDTIQAKFGNKASASTFEIVGSTYEDIVARLSTPERSAQRQRIYREVLRELQIRFEQDQQQQTTKLGSDLLQYSQGNVAKGEGEALTAYLELLAQRYPEDQSADAQPTDQSTTP